MNEMYAPTVAVADAERGETLAKRLILRLLRQLRFGALVIQDGTQRYEFGEASAATSIAARIDVHDGALYREVLLRGSIGAGESYMEGHWSSPDLTLVVRVLVLNM
ncbi:MAG: SAM-dependent methyltransferase, partial [Spongiibacteraceae bacterium]